MNEASFRELFFSDGDEFDHELDATDDEILAAGFDPDDDEISTATLLLDFDGHSAGARAILGLAVEGHHFAIEAVTGS